jgi:FkbM family methyltransferase
MNTFLLSLLGIMILVVVLGVRGLWSMRSAMRNGAGPAGGNAPSAQSSAAASLEVAAPYRLVQARYGPMLVNPNDSYVGNAILVYGEYGQIEAEFLLSLLSLRPGAVVEVGANIGSHTVPLAKALALQKRELIVFEPQPFLFQNMCANLALNAIGNVRAWPFACAERSGTLYFRAQNYRAAGNFGGVSMRQTAEPDSIAVPAVTLDEMLSETTISLMKIDVEGFELLVLQGAQKILQQSRPVLYLENDRADKSRAVVEWLWSQNYQLWWHVRPLFNFENFFGKTENIYEGYGSFNMLALPREQNIPVSDMTEVTELTIDPMTQLRKSQPR